MAGQFEYRTIHMILETWHRMHETYTDYVAMLGDGSRIEGVEMLLRRYMDEGGWNLVAITPTGLSVKSGSYSNNNHVVDTLMVIFRRQLS